MVLSFELSIFVLPVGLIISLSANVLEIVHKNYSDYNMQIYCSDAYSEIYDFLNSLQKLCAEYTQVYTVHIAKLVVSVLTWKWATVKRKLHIFISNITKISREMFFLSLYTHINQRVSWNNEKKKKKPERSFNKMIKSTIYSPIHIYAANLLSISKIK